VIDEYWERFEKKTKKKGIFSKEGFWEMVSVVNLEIGKMV